MKLPLDAIDADAMPRDRSVLSGEALEELKSSIAANGLRQPVEVYATGDGYGLISGYRRLMAVRALHELTGEDRYAAIAATLRSPDTRAAAMAEMIEENEVREALSPWDRGRIAVTARDQGLFDTLDAAIQGLFPCASRQKRARIRHVAEVVEAMEGEFDEPERFSENQLLRLSGCLRMGWRELLVTALGEIPARDHAAQWARMLPIIRETETLPTEASHQMNRPRRLMHPRPGLTLRREKTRYGYVLHLTGHQATDMFVNEIFDEIQRMFGPE